MHCTALWLLSKAASAALLSRLCDASVSWAAPAALWLCNNCILTVCFATVTDCNITWRCSTVRPANSGSCLCCSAHQGKPSRHQWHPLACWQSAIHFVLVAGPSIAHSMTCNESWCHSVQESCQSHTLLHHHLTQYKVEQILCSHFCTASAGTHENTLNILLLDAGKRNSYTAAFFLDRISNRPRHLFHSGLMHKQLQLL